MPRNESTTDRSVRVFIGSFLLFLALTGVTAWGWVGLVPLITGLYGWCPAYQALGLSTCKTG